MKDRRPSNFPGNSWSTLHRYKDPARGSWRLIFYRLFLPCYFYVGREKRIYRIALERADAKYCRSAGVEGGDETQRARMGGSGYWCVFSERFAKTRDGFFQSGSGCFKAARKR